MIGRIIVVQICWTQIVLLFFVFFQWVWHVCCCLVICLVRLLVEWLVSSVLVVRHSVLLYGARLEMFCSTCAHWWSLHDSVFPEGRCFRQVWNFRVLPLRVTVGVLCDARFVGQRFVWSSQDEWNQSVSLKFIFSSRWSLHEVGCGPVVLTSCFAKWFEFIIVRPRVTIHPMTKPHNPCPLKWM